MADNVEEFLLRYQVDVAEANRKLDQLNEKLDKTGKKGKASVAGLSEGMSAAAKGAAIAGAAIAAAMYAVTKAVRSATEEMKDFNEQWILARKTGIGSIGLEAIAGNMARSSGGRISRADSRAAVSSVADVVNAAYTDPTRMNAQNVRLRMMGISPTGANGMVASAGDVMDQLSKRWSMMTGEMARAEGDLLGVTPQAVDAIRNLHGAVTDTSDVTLEMAKRQQAAAEAAKKLNEATTGIDEDFRNIAKAITEDFMPVIASVYKAIQEGTHNVAETLKKDGVLGGMGHMGRALWEDLKERIGAGKDDTVKSLADHLKDTAKPETADEKAQAQSILDQQTKNAELDQQSSKKLELTANQFATAVAAMPGAVSMQQAIAMWAGEAAKRMLTGGAGATTGGSTSASTTGTAASGSSRGIRNNNPGNLEYGPFAKSQGATGTDGRFAIFPSMEAGVKAHEALLGGSKYLGAGLDTPAKIIAKYAPASENNQAAYLKAVGAAGFKADQKLTGADMGRFAAAMQVHESGYRGGNRSGYGRADYQRLQAGSGIANQLHMNPEQFMRETASGTGVSRGDVRYAIDAQKKGLATSILQLQGQINSAEARGQPQVAASLRGDLFRQAQQMQSLDAYSSQFLSGARAGGQERTQGAPQIQTLNINIHGITDPMEVAKEVQRQMGLEMNKVVTDADSHRTS